MQETPFDKWYNSRVKSGTKDVIDELKSCKLWLQIYYSERFSSIESILSDDFGSDVDFDEKDSYEERAQKVEASLEFLLNEMKDVLPLYDWVKSIVKGGDKVRGFFRDLRDWYNVIEAFEGFVFAQRMNYQNLETIERLKKEIDDRYPESKERDDAKLALYGKYQVSTLLWDELETPSLRNYLFVAKTFVESAVFLLADQERSVQMSAGILLRPCLEIAFRGMLYIHLLNSDFRTCVKNLPRSQSWRQNDGDTVKEFVNRVGIWAKRKNISVEKAIEDFEFNSDQNKPRAPKFRDVKNWLIKFGIFDSIPDFEQKIKKLNDDINQDIHGSMKKILFDRMGPYHGSRLFMQIILVLDIILVGILATVKDVAKEKFIGLLESKEYDLAAEKKTLLEEFIEFAKKGAFIETEKWLKSLH